jgi:hypothetical protein
MDDECSCRSDDQFERVVWLTCPGKRIKPFEDFEALGDTEKRSFWKAFEYWSLNLPHPKRHHGWTDPEYKQCYVFKDNPHRLYGFLHRSNHGERFNLCIICIYAKKKTQETDVAILDRLNRYRADEMIIRAVAALKERKEML